MENTLYYGDNLDILRRYIPDDGIDLIYLDPPFKSNQSYNILFKEKNGTDSAAQIKVFEDTWHWDEKAEETYRKITEKAPQKVADLIIALRSFLGSNDMIAYLVMMAIRLVELHRVLKNTGSIYLHCDPTASHYIKLLLDAVFSSKNYRHEIIWKCTSAHSNTKTYGNIHQSLFFYTKSDSFLFNTQYAPYEQEYIDKYYRYKDVNGRRFLSDNLVGHKGINPEYEWRGITRPWRYPKKRLDELDKKGRIFWTKNNFPRYKRYLDEMPGMPAQSIWTDILQVVSWSKEGLGYPTQKPEALLERIINASSNEGDIVLDPFCGCGTSITVAEKLKRKWFGIDVTHLAISLMKHRLKDTFGDKVKFDVKGEPVDLRGAEELAKQDRYQFQWWALGFDGARPTESEKKKGRDEGIDGYIYFYDEPGKTKKIIIQVKSGHVNPSQIRDLRGTLERVRAQIGVFITLKEPTAGMKKEALSSGFYKSPGWNRDYPRIQILTIEELLEGKRIDYPPKTNVTFKKAERHKADEHKQLIIEEKE